MAGPAVPSTTALGVNEINLKLIEIIHTTKSQIYSANFSSVNKTKSQPMTMWGKGKVLSIWEKGKSVRPILQVKTTVLGLKMKIIEYRDKTTFINVLGWKLYTPCPKKNM